MTSTPKAVEGFEGLQGMVGEPLGPSDWIEITQERVDLFADATGDHQWIHVDPARARSSPFGGTIAHGFLTLSLIPSFLPELLDVRGFSAALNYGCNRVRFPAPVPVGSRLRCAMEIDEVEKVPGGAQITATLTLEVEGASKPSCVATTVIRFYD
jgi:acyl dehydratase